MTMQVAKLGQLEKGTSAGYGMKVATEQPLDLSVSSRNLPFSGKSFYLDLPRNRSSEILVGTIRKLGGVIESFLSKEVTYVVTNNKEARTSDGATRQTNRKNCADSASMEKAEVTLRLSDKKRLSDTPSGSSGLDQKRRQKPGPNPALISRGKELLNKAMQKKDSGASILANAHSWGVHILHVNDVLDYIARLSATTKKVCNQRAEVAASSPARKVAQLKTPFLKIEDQSRLFRPLHYHFQSFPQLNLLAARGFSLFEAASPCNSRKDQKRKPKEIDPKCPTHSETEERSPKVKLTLAAKKKRKGYCECCQEAFEELVTHLYSEQHNRFALDASHYALVDHVISQFPNDFIERPPVCPDSRMLTADDVGAGFPENMVSLSEEVKLSTTGLGIIKDSTTINGCLEFLSDCLNLNMTGVERPDELADRSSPGAGKENCHIVDPSSLHLHQVNCPVETSRRRNELSFRALLEVGVQHAVTEQTGGIREETICCTLTNNTVSSLNHHFGGCVDRESTAVSRLPASVGEQMEFCHDTPSAVLEINVAKLHLGSKGLMRSDSELNETTSSVKKRKRSGHLSPQALKRRQIEPGGCLSGPLSAPYQRDEQKPVHTLSCSKRNVAGSMQASVVGQLELFPRMPCNLAQPLSALAHPTLPKDLQHYEQLLGLWECFSPRTDLDQTMPSGLTGGRDEWDLNTATPQSQTTLVKDLGFSCGIDSPALNELSLCCKNYGKGRSVLQEVQQMERVQCASPAGPLHSLPSGCGVSLQASPKRVCTVGAADALCIAPEHVLASGVKNGTGVTSVESVSSLSDWDVQLISRLGSLHAMKEHTLDVEDLRRTSVSMQDTGYESHLCSILKPKSELDWVHKEERVNASCWAEANGIPFNLFEACLNGLTS
ncbi:protein DBF4 homolog B [Lissotriton helveticus]